MRGNIEIMSVSKALTYAQTIRVKYCRARRQTAIASLTARPEERGATLFPKQTSVTKPKCSTWNICLKSKTDTTTSDQRITSNQQSCLPQDDPAQTTRGRNKMFHMEHLFKISKGMRPHPTAKPITQKEQDQWKENTLYSAKA